MFGRWMEDRHYHQPAHIRKILSYNNEAIVLNVATASMITAVAVAVIFSSMTFYVVGCVCLIGRVFLEEVLDCSNFIKYLKTTARMNADWNPDFLLLFKRCIPVAAPSHPVERPVRDIKNFAPAEVIEEFNQHVKFYNLHGFSYFNERVLNRKAIATAAPSENFFATYWDRIVWRSEAKCMVVLNNFDDERRNATPYFPDSVGETKTYGDVAVAVLEKTEVALPGNIKLVERKFKITHGQESREIKHFHVLNWEDYSVIPEEALAELIIRVEAHVDIEKAVFIAHCFAGVGRTGTFLAAYQGYSRLKINPDAGVDILKIALDLRTERAGSIQTPDQYHLVYKTAKHLQSHLTKKPTTASPTES